MQSSMADETTSSGAISLSSNTLWFLANHIFQSIMATNATFLKRILNGSPFVLAVRPLPTLY
ncbi:hypothetical protein HN51_040296 [Arachis hypogaea]